MKQFTQLAAIVLFFTTTLSLRAQTSIRVPVPAPFATAHKIFLAPAGSPSIPNAENYVAMMYVSTYQMLSSIKYEMVTTPAEADLSMEVSIVSPPAAVLNNVYLYIHLTVRDVKTHALLWSIDSPLEYAYGSKNAQNDFNKAESRIADDLRALANGTIPQSPSASDKKARFSQEK